MARVLKALDYAAELALRESDDSIPYAEPTLKRLRLAKTVVDYITKIDDGLIRKIYLYGSTAKGRAHPNSDLDLLFVVETDSVNKHDLRVKFYETIQRLIFTTDVYISLQMVSSSDWKQKSTSFHEEVVETGIQLFERKGGGRTALEASA